MAAKRPTWKDSKYADAKGKFKKLSPSSLATWLIKSRRKNKKAIIGSLNQQIVFNRKKRPSYAKKMVTTRNIVNKRLGSKTK
jgi:predicted transglutaminase-like protease|tara:strand:- start:428 stop:673 length:246 start_codon:yes stop_codon:yes gene_type:complete